MSERLEPSEGAITRFVDALFRYADPDTFVSLRAFDQFRRDVAPVLIEGVQIGEDVAGVVHRAIKAAGSTANRTEAVVFAPPVATFNGPRIASMAELANGVALSVEMDAGDPKRALAQLTFLIGPPTIVVASGGEWTDPDTGEIHPKQHFHWRLTEPTRTEDEHRRLQAAREMAASLVGADPTAAPPCHPLRWPGSWNRKGKPRLADILVCNEGAEIDLGDAYARLEEAVEAAGLRGAGDVPKASGAPQAPVQVIVSALAAIPNEELHWDDWTKMGLAVWRATGGSAEGLNAWADWSAKSKKHDDQACVDRWKHFAQHPPTRIGAGTIFFRAASYGWQRPVFAAPGGVGMDEREAPPHQEEDLRAGAEPGAGFREPPRGEYAESRQKRQEDRRRPAKPLALIDPTKWVGEPPQREWVVPMWVPKGVVTGFYGDGAAGKSLSAQQLLTSVALCLPWFGINVVPGTALGVFCEDDSDELWRRQRAIMKSIDQSMGTLENLRLLSRFGAESNALLTFDGSDVGTFTDFYHEIDATCAELKPSILVLDTIADLYPGNENNRGQVRQFVQAALGGLARKHQCAVVALGHPSVTGMNNGSGQSGSTAWNNTFRSRLYLTREEGDDADPNGRLLTRKKSNYGPRDAELKIQWHEGAFRLQDPGPTFRASDVTWAQINEIFDELDRAWKAGDPWSPFPQTKATGRYFPMWARQLGLQESRIKALVSEWQMNGFLSYEEVSAKTKKNGLRVLKRLHPDAGR